MPGWMKWAIAILAGIAIIYVGWRWAPWLLTSFFILNCFVLIIVVLLQSGKAADLAGAFGGAGSQTAFGPRGAANVLSRATTWCAIMFMACALSLVLRQNKSAPAGSSILQQVSKPAPPQKPAATPPAQQPPAGQTQSPQGATPAQPATSQPAPPPAKKP